MWFYSNMLEQTNSSTQLLNLWQDSEIRILSKSGKWYQIELTDSCKTEKTELCTCQAFLYISASNIKFTTQPTHHIECIFLAHF